MNVEKEFSHDEVTNEANNRPKDETIAQSGGGIPDISDAPLTTSDEEIARVRDRPGAEHRQDEKDDLERQLERPKHGTV